MDGYHYLNPLALSGSNWRSCPQAHLCFKTSKRRGLQGWREPRRERGEKQKRNYAKDRGGCSTAPAQVSNDLKCIIWKVLFYVEMSGGADSNTFLGVTVSLGFHEHFTWVSLLTPCPPGKLLLSTDFTCQRTKPPSTWEASKTLYFPEKWKQVRPKQALLSRV